jgi:hypothetical protein
MGRHLAEVKRITRFDLRYYRYLFLILYIKVKKLVKATLNRG